MAMALNRRKQLHIHVVPFMILSLGFIVAVTLLSVVVFKANQEQSITQLLTVRLYDVEPSSNGLAHISRHDASAIETSQKTLTSSLGGLGQSASLQAAVYAK